MRSLCKGSRHGNFFVALLAGVVSALVAIFIVPDLFVSIAASVFSLVYIARTVIDLHKLTPDYLRDHAGDEDAPPFILFVLTLGIIVYVMVELFVAANAGEHNVVALTLGVASVALTWLMIHLMWGTHYAWQYYEAHEAEGGTNEVGGLDFPGGEKPDGSAFMYFSLVVAMTAQTSDTDVTSNRMRRIVVGHSLFSYLFNTVVVAAAVNIVVSLANAS